MFTKKFKSIYIIAIFIIAVMLFSACAGDVIETTGYNVEKTSEDAIKVIEKYREEHGHDPSEEELEALIAESVETPVETSVSTNEVVEPTVESTETNETNENSSTVNTVTEENTHHNETTTTIPRIVETVTQKQDVIRQDAANSHVSSGSSNSDDKVATEPSTNTETPHTHSYGSWTTTKNATCAATGTKERTCSKCNHKETQTIAKTTSHTWNSGKVTKEATTTATGVKTYTCTVCGTTKTETIPKKTVTPTPTAHTHSYGNWATTKAATCTANGMKERMCSCGQKETQVINSLGHSYTNTVVAPTTSAKGYTLHKCSKCGDEYKDNWKDKLPTATPTPAPHSHSYGSWTTTKAATCTANGTQERKCSCGQKETQTIQATGHSYGNWTLSGSKQTRKCSKCGNTESKDAGKKWVVDVPYQAAVYNEVELLAERTVWWVTYSQYDITDDRYYSSAYDIKITTLVESEYIAKKNETMNNGTYKTAGFYPESYVTGTEKLLVTPEVQEQGHWEYFIQ